MYENKPLVSVLMTAFNRQAYIGDAIQTVLDSSYENFELIIVDDCSTDNTLKIANDFALKDARIKVYKNDQNLGDYFNRNKAASYATGKYIKYLDSDDLIYPFSLAIMVEAMEDNPVAFLGISHFSIQIDASPFPVVFLPEEAYYQHFFKGGLLFTGPSGSIVRTDYFKQIGGFSGKRYISDTELWLKIVATKPVLLLQPSLIWWRRHDSQEFNLGHINDEYIKLNYELNRSCLSDDKCPLTKKSRQAAIRNYKNRFARKIFKKMLVLKLKDAKNMNQYSKLTPQDFVKALMPLNKIKKLMTRFSTRSSKN